MGILIEQEYRLQYNKQKYIISHQATILNEWSLFYCSLMERDVKRATAILAKLCLGEVISPQDRDYINEYAQMFRNEKE